MGKFVISKRSNGEFQFVLRADNHLTILTSEGYKTQSGCENGIAAVKKNAPDDSRYERKISGNGKYYFVLKAANGEPIGISEMYGQPQTRDNGIESVKKNAPGAEVEG